MYPITISLEAVSEGMSAGALHNTTSGSSLASSVIYDFTVARAYRSSALQIVTKGHFWLVVSSSAITETISDKIMLEIKYGDLRLECNTDL